MKTLTGNSRRREQRIQSALLDRLALTTFSRIRTEVRRGMLDIFERGAVAEAEHNRRISAILNRTWTASARPFVDRVLDGVPQEKRVVPIFRTEVMDGVVARWIATTGGNKITEITETTKADINRVLAGATRDGLGEREAAKLVKQVALSKSFSRARTIARTETHAAANVATQGAAELAGAQLGIQFKRVWVAALDDRTRDSASDHRAADGQQRGMTEPFSVSGELLMQPGDPSGSPGNVINCRCAVVYEPA